MERLRDEFAKKVRRKATALEDIRDIVDRKLAQMLVRNPTRMDYQRRYEEIVTAYNSEKDRATIEQTFAALIALVETLDEEELRATREGLTEDELAMFDCSRRTVSTRPRASGSSRSASPRLAELDRFWEKEQTKGEVEILILDEIYAKMPSPPLTDDEKIALSKNVYAHVWQQAVRGQFSAGAHA
jgi:type I restriction enzyme R subunit